MSFDQGCLNFCKFCQLLIEVWIESCVSYFTAGVSKFSSIKNSNFDMLCENLGGNLAVVLDSELCLILLIHAVSKVAFHRLRNIANVWSSSRSRQKNTSINLLQAVFDSLLKQTHLATTVLGQDS